MNLRTITSTSLTVICLSTTAFAWREHTAFNQGDLEQETYPIIFAERSSDISTPLTDEIGLYAKDNAGTTTLYTKDSAGTVTALGAGGGSGDIEGVTAGTGLTGGGTTGTVTVDVGEGLAIDAAADSVAFDPTEITGGTTWDDGGEASVAWTYNLSGTDPVLTAVSGGFDVTGDLDISSTIEAGSGNITITNSTGNLDGTKVADADLGDVTVTTGAWAVEDNSHTHDATTLSTDSVSADELNATGVEAELEAVLDLQDLQGAVTDGQVPNTITVDLATMATTANAGDSATAFFSSGTIEHERGGLEADVSAYSGIPAITAGATYSLDTIGELETAVAGVNILLETEIDASSELLALMDDETGTGALTFATAPTFTTSIQMATDLGDILDGNGNELFQLDTVTSAINEFTVANAAIGTNPTISATGDDTNIGINLTTKGTGGVVITSSATATQSVVTSGLVVNNAGAGNAADDFVAKTDNATAALLVDASADTVTSNLNSLGWVVVDQTDNQACTTGCTFACVFGIENATGTAVTNLVSCDGATADLCVCAGAS